MSSAQKHELVTPGTAIAGRKNYGSITGIYIGVSGDVSMTMDGPAGNTTIVYKNMAAGVLHPCSPISVNSSLTTATDIIAVWG